MTGARGWVLVAIAGVAACGDGQASPEYRGEPLMSLNGVVASSESALSGDLVPALIASLPVYAERSYEQRYFISGDVEGTFPSAFTMRIYDAPPADTLFPLIEGESAFVLIQLAAVSSEHPAWIKRTQKEVSGEEVVDDLELCSDTECITANLWSCTANGADLDSWPCGRKLPESLHWNAYGYSSKHSVVYFEEALAAGSTLAHLFARGSAVDAGYHVVELDSTTNTPENIECYRRAFARARMAWQVRKGYPFDDVTIIGTPAEQLEYDRLSHPFIAMEGCISGWRIVDDRARVELEFIDMPSRVATF